MSVVSTADDSDGDDKAQLLLLVRDLHELLSGAVRWLDNVGDRIGSDKLIDAMPNNIKGRQKMHDGVKRAERWLKP